MGNDKCSSLQDCLKVELTCSGPCTNAKGSVGELQYSNIVRRPMGVRRPILGVSFIGAKPKWPLPNDGVVGVGMDARYKTPASHPCGPFNLG